MLKQIPSAECLKIAQQYRRSLGFKIVKEYRRNAPTKIEYQEKNTPTFREFVEYVVDTKVEGIGLFENG